MANKPWAAYGLPALLFLYSAYIVFFPVTDTDIWWHLAAGREMVARRAFLFQDPFSFTPTLQPWINLHWLFQLIVYPVYLRAGCFGLVLLKASVFASAIVLIFRSNPEKENRIIRFGLFALALFAVRYLVPERPVVFSLLFVAIFLVRFERFSREGSFRTLLLLIPVQILWVNMQGLSALGLAVAAAYLVESWFRRQWHWKLAAFFLAMVGCLFITPYGWNGAWHPFRLLFHITPSFDPLYALNISENTPLWRITGPDAGYAVAVGSLAFLCLASARMGTKAVRISHGLLFLAFLYLAVIAVRNSLLFIVMGLFLLNQYLPDFFQNRGRGIRRVAALGSILAFAIPGLVHANVLVQCRGLHWLSPFRVPESAVSFLKASPIPGNLFNADRYGGYITWTMYPDEKTYIDGRFLLRPPGIINEYFSALDAPGQFEIIQKKYGITHVLLPVAVFFRYRELIASLYKNPEWSLIYTDGSCVLFAARGLATAWEISLADPDAIRSISGQITARWSGNALVRDEALASLTSLRSFLVR